MAYPLSSDPLKQSVRKPAINHRGEYLGEITDVTSVPSKAEIAEYVIIKSDLFDGRVDRFFAVPASSKLIKITEDGVIFTVAKDDLILAKRIPADQCPTPNIDFDPSTYELSRYLTDEKPENSNIHR